MWGLVMPYQTGQRAVAPDCLILASAAECRQIFSGTLQMVITFTLLVIKG